MSISCDASIEKNMQDVRIWLPINIKEFFVSLGNLYYSQVHKDRLTMLYDSAEFFVCHLQKNERSLATLTLRILRGILPY